MEKKYNKNNILGLKFTAGKHAKDETYTIENKLKNEEQLAISWNFGPKGQNVSWDINAIVRHLNSGEWRETEGENTINNTYNIY